MLASNCPASTVLNLVSGGFKKLKVERLNYSARGMNKIFTVIIDIDNVTGLF
jgi:predicted chitinase